MPKSNYVKMDNKEMIFTPGKGGSLMSMKKTQPSSFDFSPRPKAKVIVSPALRKKRNTLTPALVGANRG